MKQRSIVTDDRSTREIVLLFCDSDVVIRSWVPDDYSPLFLLPKSAYIEINENRGNRSWLESNWELMRIFYYQHSQYDKALNDVIDEAVKKVKEKLEKTTLGDITDLAALKDQLEAQEGK